jgi:hypothetical protein
MNFIIILMIVIISACGGQVEKITVAKSIGFASSPQEYPPKNNLLKKDIILKLNELDVFFENEMCGTYMRFISFGGYENDYYLRVDIAKNDFLKVEQLEFLELSKDNLRSWQNDDVTTFCNP